MITWDNLSPEPLVMKPIPAIPTALDLYCGVGGLSLGLHQAGFRLLGGIDADPLSLNTHRANFPGVPAVERDLFRATGREIRADLKLGRTQIDLLAGGPPCQGFSSGGVRAQSDHRNQGVLAFARLVVELRPRYFLMENVRGFLFQDYAALRQEFCDTLAQAGYVTHPFLLLNAADFGVPQRRRRVFVLGHRRRERAPTVPTPATTKPTVRDAIGDLLLIDSALRGAEDDGYAGDLGAPSRYARALRGSPAGRKVAPLTGCLVTRHSEEVEGRFRATEPGGQEAISRFYRLSWDGISPTLRAGTGPEHGSHTAPRPIHPERPRCITVREAARLHSFPDWFAFHGTRWHGFRQIGNSVPPFLARAVGASVLNAIIGV